MSITIATVSAFVARQALNLVVGEIKQGIVAALSPQLQTTEDRIEQVVTQLRSLEAKQDLLLAQHLKAACTYLRLGELADARRELVVAEATDHRAALAKLWLALLFSLEGREEIALEKLRDALELNPFICHLVLPPLPLDSGKPGPWERTSPSQTWSANIADINASAPGRSNYKVHWAARLLNSDAPDTGWCGVEAVSASGGNPAVVWCAGPCNHHFVEDRYLGVLNLDTGKPVWIKRLDRSNSLFLAAPRVLVLTTETREEFTFLDARTGTAMPSMNAAYFDTVYCPGFATLQQTDAFQRSSAVLPVPRCATTQDERVLTDPYGWDLYRFEVRNRWEYEHYTTSVASPGDSFMPNFEEEIESLTCVSTFQRLLPGADPAVAGVLEGSGAGAMRVRAEAGTLEAAKC